MKEKGVPKKPQGLVKKGSPDQKYGNCIQRKESCK